MKMVALLLGLAALFPLRAGAQECARPVYNDFTTFIKSRKLVTGTKFDVRGKEGVFQSRDTVYRFPICGVNTRMTGMEPPTIRVNCNDGSECIKREWQGDSVTMRGVSLNRCGGGSEC
ncbi:hypothetical protein [Methylobacterium sp. J-068]|uniref:hypothetical protein n=1 Tax=Methylobacterium sp. J-068 TaxID=2836649 RepID=UPI001FB897E4|nr:hypothetical protein [Methylobacterium sp. J-068]MCJ2036424.1 hypothetical protein [Methylobacterium sp. J-068]